MRYFATPRNGILGLTIVVFLSGIVALWVNRLATPNPDMAGLDLLVWLAIPAVIAALYLTLGRIWQSAGLGLRLRGNGAWFLMAATLPPALAGVLLLINQVTGLVRLDPAMMQAGALAGLASLAVFVPKNVVEEFVFRGFLAGRFADTVRAGLQGHVLTGLIWAAWHIIYWLALLPSGKIAEVSGLTPPVFVILGFVALPLQSILLGELRLVTGSIWAGVVLHSLNNAFLAGLVVAQALPRGDLTAMLLTPVDFGLIYTGIMAVIGVFMWRRRTKAGVPAARV